MVYNYPTYISKVGLTPADAILLEENVDQRFAISLVARDDNQDSEKIQVLRRAMTSDTVRTFLEDEHSENPAPLVLTGCRRRPRRSRSGPRGRAQPAQATLAGPAGAGHRDRRRRCPTRRPKPPKRAVNGTYRGNAAPRLVDRPAGTAHAHRFH